MTASGEDVTRSTGADQLTEELNPEIGLLCALAIGVGTMIAADIFVLSGLAVTNVRAVARRTGAAAYAVYGLSPDASDEDRRQGESMLPIATESVGDVDIETTLLESDDVVAALVEESADHDLTIIGATREGVFQKFIFGTIPETVAERAPATVIMTKRSLDVGERLQQSVTKLQERATGYTDPLEVDETP
jgi:nucleotide-binding universal stress UspA family protein